MQVCEAGLPSVGNVQPAWLWVVCLMCTKALPWYHVNSPLKSATMPHRFWVLIFLAGYLVTPPAAYAATWFVTPAGAGLQDGSAWAKAWPIDGIRHPVNFAFTFINGS